MRAKALSVLLPILLAGCTASAPTANPPSAPAPPSTDAARTAFPAPLDHAPLVRAKAAAYLTADDPVLGIQLGDDFRAYPLRLLDGPAVANDTVNGRPVAVAWCRACGSATAYETDTPKGTLTLTAAGTYGAGDQLLRDRETGTLWAQLTGKPVEGPLAGSGIVLRPLPVVLTPWASWTRVHPETRVLAQAGPAGEAPAAASPAPAAPSSPPVFGLVVDGKAKAYPIDALVKTGVVNDEVGGRPVLVVWEAGADPQNRTIRAYDRGGHTFARAERAFLGLVFLNDETGRPWRLGEDAATTPDGKRIPRLPGALTTTAAWSAAYPETQTYAAPGQAAIPAEGVETSQVR